MELNNFIKKLKANSPILTRQEFRTLKGQAIKGDVEGAKKGLAKLLERKRKIYDNNRKI